MDFEGSGYYFKNNTSVTKFNIKFSMCLCLYVCCSLYLLVNFHTSLLQYTWTQLLSHIYTLDPEQKDKIPPHPLPCNDTVASFILILTAFLLPSFVHTGSGKYHANLRDERYINALFTHHLLHFLINREKILHSEQHSYFGSPCCVNANV